MTTIGNTVKQALAELDQDKNFQYLLSHKITNVWINMQNTKYFRARSCLDLTPYRTVEEGWTELLNRNQNILLDPTDKDEVKKYIMAFYFAVVLLQVLVDKIISTGKIFTSASSGKSLTAGRVNGSYILVDFWYSYIDHPLYWPLTLYLYDTTNVDEEYSCGCLNFRIYLKKENPTSNYMDWPISVEVEKTYAPHILIADPTVVATMNKLSDINYTNIQKLVDKIY